MLLLDRFRDFDVDGDGVGGVCWSGGRRISGTCAAAGLPINYICCSMLSYELYWSQRPKYRLVAECDDIYFNIVLVKQKAERGSNAIRRGLVEVACRNES